MDQSGSGKGDRLTGINPVINSVTGTAMWPHQQVELLYGWNNVFVPTGQQLRIGTGASCTLHEGIQFFSLGARAVPPQEVFDSYKAAVNGVDYLGPFTYPHPLTGAAPGSIIQLTGFDLQFSNVLINTSSIPETLRVANTGTAVLNVASIGYPTGFNGATAGFSVNPGAFSDIPVTFTPTAAIAYSGNITVTSNATSGGNTIAVTGTGVLPTPPPVFTLSVKRVEMRRNP